jgi:hypothetical protein
MYKQCLLQKGSAYRVGWIPTKFAVVGKCLKLYLDDGWIDGWKVLQIGMPHVACQVEEHERDYKHQREASDI